MAAPILYPTLIENRGATVAVSVDPDTLLLLVRNDGLDPTPIAGVRWRFSVLAAPEGAGLEAPHVTVRSLSVDAADSIIVGAIEGQEKAFFRPIEDFVMEVAKRYIRDHRESFDRQRLAFIEDRIQREIGTLRRLAGDPRFPDDGSTKSRMVSDIWLLEERLFNLGPIDCRYGWVVEASDGLQPKAAATRRAGFLGAFVYDRFRKVWNEGHPVQRAVRIVVRNGRVFRLDAEGRESEINVADALARLSA